MGIKNLRGYIQRQNVTKKYRLQDTKLVIDGKNLCHELMETSYTGTKYGGNYDVFSDHVEKFFNSLRNCNVQPYVVMDGAHDSDDKKFDCLLERCKKRISNISNDSKKCFPILSHRCFTYTIKKLGIPIEACNYEADHEIASLAKSWKCPVLSNDNDFYIYDLPGGFIRLNDLNFNRRTKTECFTYIDTSIYYSENIHESLGISPSVLPLLVVFLDNDYYKLDKAIIKQFVSKELKISAKKAELKLKKPIDVMIEILRPFADTNEGIDALSRCLDNHIAFLSNEEKCQIIYNAKVILKQFTLENVTETENNNLFNSEEKIAGTPVIPFPSWLIQSIRNCEISPFIINVLDKRVLLKPNLEDLTQEFIYEIASPIRQIIYKMATGKKLQEVVVEHHRENCHMVQTRILPITSNLKLGKIPSLNMMQGSEEEVRLSCLANIFLFPLEKLVMIPKVSRMFILAINYLAKNSGLKESTKGIKCLLFCHMLLLSKAYGHIYDLPVDSACVDKVFEYCADDHRVPFDTALLHEFQKLQIVIDILYDLNGLFMFPLEIPNPNVMYKSGLMYPLFTKTDNEKHLDRIIETCLEKESPLRITYSEILKLLLENLK
ncbi:Hypothetical predicted protein [Mytilus galloprovincialis]|uniref:Asteroid domain-containing protein n=1 Tax=Mytilus galloprovincialis TaxID=29158 RepID=A0A8B6BTR2_MYTGA|nr:Hypothetical predicted protein [Mytilus galloprovincialis]